MTPVVSGERATATWLTGLTGLLVLAAAVVMMVVAAPAHSGPHHTARAPQLQACDVVRAPWPDVPVAMVDPCDIAAVAAVALTSATLDEFSPGIPAAGRAARGQNGARR